MTRRSAGDTEINYFTKQLSVIPSPPECVLKAPEELQGEFIGQKHGGAHWEASDGVHGRSTEENLCTLRLVAVDDAV